MLTSTKRLPMTVVLALLLLTANWARATDAYVLSAGVDNYPTGVGKLQGCLADARNTTAAFTAQQGKLFQQVHSQTLLDGQATHANILQQMRAMSNRGVAGDYVIVFLSGHGGRTNNNQTWYFLPFDYQSQRHGQTALTDRQILDAADVLVKQNKKVFVIVDACFAGQLNISAQPYMQNYRNAQGGGLVLMLSSSAGQLSQALGQYSAFAKAFADSMVQGDLNRDGKITLAEIRQDSPKRTQDLINAKKMTAKQDAEIHWSPSINGNMPLALLNGSNPNPQPPISVARKFAGSESLQGFGSLAFDLLQGGRAIMHDTSGTSEGYWTASGNVVTLRFSNGRVIYTGTLNGNTLSGTARNERTSWNFTVREGAAPAPQPQPVGVAGTWTGNESLQGFGRLSFVLHQNGRAVMHDAQSISEGTWRLNGNQVTLLFSNGRVVYTGTLQGNMINGTAQNDRTSWTFSVRVSPQTALNQ